MAESSANYILIVDDVAFMRRLLVGIIKNLGHDVVEAENGSEAIRIIEQNPPRLIFLDLMMPQMSGFEVCEWVRKNEATKKTPVIICTAHQDRKTVEKAIRAGASDVLCKPVSRDNIRARLDRHLQPAATSS